MKASIRFALAHFISSVTVVIVILLQNKNCRHGAQQPSGVSRGPYSKNNMTCDFLKQEVSYSNQLQNGQRKDAPLAAPALNFKRMVNTLFSCLQIHFLAGQLWRKKSRLRKRYYFSRTVRLSNKSRQYKKSPLSFQTAGNLRFTGFSRQAAARPVLRAACRCKRRYRRRRTGRGR